MRKTGRFPTLDQVWILGTLLLIGFRVLVVPVPQNDFWWHLATGRAIVETGEIPRVDQFSYTQAGEDFYNQAWLAQVLMYGLYSLGGVSLLILVQSFVLMGAYGLLLWLCICRTGAIRLSAALLIITVLISFDNWTIRPQSYALPLCVAFLTILTNWRLKLSGGWLWLLPILMLVWVNLHGSFVLGGALMAITFGGVLLTRLGTRSKQTDDAPDTAPPPLRSLFVWGLVTATAMLVNPRGIEVIGYVLGLLGTSSVTNLVEEWASPIIRTFTGARFFIFVMFVVAVLAYARRRPDLVDMLLAGAFFWLALGAERNIIWFALVVLPLLVVQATSILRPETDQPPKRSFQGVPAFNAVLLGLIALGYLAVLPWIKPNLSLPPTLRPLIGQNTPVVAVEHLQAEPDRPERLFHAMAYGSYLIWAAPEQPVFIDPRIELYPFEQWRDYITLSAGRNLELLDEYAIDGLLLDLERQPQLVEQVRQDKTWEERYSNEHTVYLVRRE